MTSLEVHDAVVLKSDRLLYGTVERTHIDGFDHLDDQLIIAHVPVPLHILHDFANKGIPPKGYVFVRFYDEALGYSLVPEADLDLLCRPLQLGTTVKSHSHHMTGRVTNVSDSFLLRPVIFDHPDRSTLDQCFERPLHAPECEPQCSIQPPLAINYLHPHELIHDVPGHELKGALDVIEGDCVIHNEWVGMVVDTDVEIVVVLDDGSIVALDDSLDVHLPITESDKPLVRLSEFDQINRPDYVVAVHGFSSTIPITDPRRGQVVAADTSRKLSCRWLRGAYNPSIPRKGTILDIRTTSLEVSWVDANGFSVTRQGSELPSVYRRYYENHRTYKSNTELRRRKDIVAYDCGRQPEDKGTLTGLQISEHQDYRPGDRVRFRDPAAAAIKYSGLNGTTHGRYVRIPPQDTDGWDLNELEVVFCTQKCTVQWQDGSQTTTPSTELRRYALFEAELIPADIVVKREGMKQRHVKEPNPAALLLTKRRQPKSPAEPFNEMTFMERPHDLIPEKVGVVQSVDSRERVARVRWFISPRIELCLSGYSLSPASQFGPIGDLVEDVSLYEILSFPALECSLQDMVTIPPTNPSKTTLKYLRDPHPWHPALSFAELRARSMEAQERFRGIDCAEDLIRDRNLHKIFSRNNGTSDEITKSKFDWIGKIMALKLDGSVLVRLGCESPAVDRGISRDYIISTVDETLAENDPDEDDENFLDLLQSDEEHEKEIDAVIEESVEYEGGDRLDEDSGDENWVSEDEAMSDISDAMQQDDTLADDESDIPDLESVEGEPEFELPQNIATDASSHLSLLKTYLTESAPPSFEILSADPPQDQYKLREPAVSHTTSFTKRVLREHKILASSLPVGEIYVRTYESRLDLLRCLIIGPKDTPYEFAPLMIDLHLGANFPKEPPKANFYSWSGGIGRINPNLYEEGRICLSLLGTWPGKAEDEGWSEKATILQVLVSLQGLVLVKKPFYNEAGFDDYEHENLYVRESLQYSEKAFVVARGFIKHALFSPPGGIQDILAWNYLPHQRDQNSSSSPSKFSTEWSADNLLEKALQRSQSLIQKSEEMTGHLFNKTQQIEQKDQAMTLMDGAGRTEDANASFLAPLSKGALVMLNRTITELEEALWKLALDKVVGDHHAENAEEMNTQNSESRHTPTNSVKKEKDNDKDEDAVMTG